MTSPLNKKASTELRIEEIAPKDRPRFLWSMTHPDFRSSRADDSIMAKAPHGIMHLSAANEPGHKLHPVFMEAVEFAVNSVNKDRIRHTCKTILANHGHFALDEGIVNQWLMDFDSAIQLIQSASDIVAAEDKAAIRQDILAAKQAFFIA